MLDTFTRKVRIPYNLDEILEPKRYRDGGIDNNFIADVEEKLNSCFIKLDDWLKDELIKFIKNHSVFIRDKITVSEKSIKALNKSIKKIEKEHPISDINNDDDLEIFNKKEDLKLEVQQRESINNYLREQKEFIRDWTKEKRKELVKINKQKRKEEDKRIDKMLDRLSSENDGNNKDGENFDFYPFINSKVLECFNIYKDKHIVEPYVDYSYLFQRLKERKLILHITHNNFKKWLKDNELIKEKVFDSFLKYRGFRSLKKSYSIQRENNFNNVFSQLP